MTTFQVCHHTTYSYDRPVSFGDHRLMMRPRDGHDLRLLDSRLTVSPPADIRWEFDTFGNSVALLMFPHPAKQLVVRSELTVRRYGHDDPIDRLTRHTGPYPFEYDREEGIDLAPAVALLFPGDRAALGTWLASKIPFLPDETMALLDALVQAIHGGFSYSRRETAGVQSPAETIRLGSGTCRDFAVLFMEAARHLGFAARFVTGYLYDPATDEARARGTDEAAVRGGGATHAWADVFVRGAGWVEFDPTNRIIAGRNLIRIATTRSPSQALPLSGTFERGEARFLGMEVEVGVARVT